MNILNLEKVIKSYSEKILLNNISLGINEGDKIGVIGVNGTGKSTLLKIIAGTEIPDGGKVIKANNINIEYLPQTPIFRDGESVLDNVFRGDTRGMKELREYETLIQKAIENPENKLIQTELMNTTSKIDAMDLWNLENEAKSILIQLGINDFKQEVNTLSGGQKKRVAMAGALINPANLLILDEPTNHIDNATVDWLEKYLIKFTGSLIMVTHDRYFLDRVSNRIIELDGGNLYSYKANYSQFLNLKLEREDMEQATERKRKSILQVELEWIRRGAKARSTKQKARIERYEDMKAISSPATKENVEINSISSRLGKKIIAINNISKSYNNQKLIEDFSYIVLRNDRIGIIGNNGCGKSTLLKLLAKIIETDKGNIDIGETVKIGFFTQEGEDIDENLKIIEYIRQTAEYINTPDGKITASQMLEKFLFPSHLQYTPISKLSGGEKRRLYLLNILINSPNILFLDEPTNDLDIQTLTILEEYLDTFQGAVIVVSHDRYFLDRVVNKIFSFQSQNIKQYEGNYSDYAEAIELELQTKEILQTKQQPIKKIIDIPQKLKFTFNEQREFEQIDNIIVELENEIIEINKKMEQSLSNYILLEELTQEKEKKETQLERVMNRWLYLNDLADKIKSQNY